MRNWVCLANRIFYLFDVIVGRHSAHSYTISHLHRDRGIPSSSLATVTYRKTNAQWRRRWLLVVVRWRKSRRWADWTKPTRRMYVCCVCVCMRGDAHDVHPDYVSMAMLRRTNAYAHTDQDQLRWPRIYYSSYDCCHSFIFLFISTSDVTRVYVFAIVRLALSLTFNFFCIN